VFKSEPRFKDFVGFRHHETAKTQYFISFSLVTMIRQGKSSWLQLSTTAVPVWCTVNDISFKNARIAKSSAHEGLGVVSEKNLTREDGALIQVPTDMVLNQRRIHELATADARLRELLTSCLPWAASARIFILLFLLYQATGANPDVNMPSGTWSTPFTGYGANVLTSVVEFNLVN
jgi:hypothetical protein